MAKGVKDVPALGVISKFFSIGNAASNIIMLINTATSGSRDEVITSSVDTGVSLIGVFSVFSKSPLGGLLAAEGAVVYTAASWADSALGISDWIGDMAPTKMNPFNLSSSQFNEYKNRYIKAGLAGSGRRRMAARTNTTLSTDRYLDLKQKVIESGVSNGPSLEEFMSFHDRQIKGPYFSNTEEWKKYNEIKSYEKRHLDLLKSIYAPVVSLSGSR